MIFNEDEEKPDNSPLAKKKYCEMPSEKKKKLKQENHDLESVSLIKQEPVSSSSHSDDKDSTSPTKKKKHKHSKSKDSVSENGMGSMGQVSDNVFSPRKRKLTENELSPNPASSKKKKKKKHSQESDSVDDDASSSVTNSSVVSSSLQVEDNGGYGRPREKTQLHDFRCVIVLFPCMLRAVPEEIV